MSILSVADLKNKARQAEESAHHAIRAVKIVTTDTDLLNGYKHAMYILQCVRSWKSNEDITTDDDKLQELKSLFSMLDKESNL